MPIVSVEQFKTAKFDYLILGGGTAGLALAARLTENKDVVVGVIEAGGYHKDVPEVDVPGFMGRTIANPTYDWTFLSVPQARANGRIVLQPRGKGLGGSSLNNFLGMFRPAKEEFDALEQLGNTGWNWESLLEYMKKSETVLPSGLSSSDARKYAAEPDPLFHGTSGPIKKSFPSVWTKQHALLFDAAEALGVPRNPEMGNGTNVGAMTSFTSVDSRTAKRSYSAPDYYEPNANRPNLLVLTLAQVVKVVLEPEADGLHKATGVEFVHEGTRWVVGNVKKDIVLSAGALQTPQLLELSGIGDSAILQKHGIKSLVDLPGVGENLQDHVCVSSIVEIDPKFETMDILSIPEQLKKHQDLYAEQKGLLSSVPAPGFLFLSGKDLGSADDLRSWQEHADILASANIDSLTSSEVKSGLKKQYDLQRTWFKDDHLAQAEILNYIGHQPIPHPVPVPGKRYTSLVSALTHPLSRGTVHIASSDPLAPPLIDPNYFANEADLDLLVRIVKFTLKLLATPPLGDIVRGHVLPGPDVLGASEDGRDERLREWVKATCGPVFHPMGTAAMLPRADGGVVDSELRVYGTKNLRVVDVSILPMELSCHIQSVAYAIGEKAADILKA